MYTIYEDIIKQHLAKKMKETRNKLELTQEQMSEKLKITPRSYIDIEHGNSLCKTTTLFHFLSFFHDPCQLTAEILQLMADAVEDAK